MKTMQDSSVSVLHWLPMLRSSWVVNLRKQLHWQAETSATQSWKREKKKRENGNYYSFYAVRRSETPCEHAARVGERKPRRKTPKEVSNLIEKYCSRYYDHIKSKLNIISISLFLQVISIKTKKIPPLPKKKIPRFSANRLNDCLQARSLCDHMRLDSVSLLNTSWLIISLYTV